MKRVTIMIICIVLAGLVTAQGLVGKSKQKQPPRDHIEDVKKLPSLGIDYARIARFKLGSRKTTYRIGEMIGVDLALMNMSGTPVFFHQPFLPGLVFNALDEKGMQIPVNNYTTAFEALSLESYRQIEPGYLMSASFSLLAGCTSDLDAFLEKKHEITLEESPRGEGAYLKRVFEGSLFVNWGQACLDVKTPGRYTITAEQTNGTVRVSPERPKVKTAVGTIRSTPLTLTITD